jgi:hypothetical protein
VFDWTHIHVVTMAWGWRLGFEGWGLGALTISDTVAHLSSDFRRLVSQRLSSLSVSATSFVLDLSPVQLSHLGFGSSRSVLCNLFPVIDSAALILLHCSPVCDMDAIQPLTQFLDFPSLLLPPPLPFPSAWYYFEDHHIICSC